ncbi:MAG: hypothetical protein ACRDHM_10670 [Actinomycetota bacterium]
MLVCPNCRSENLEDASVCRHCGNALDAVSSPMRRLDRTEQEQEEESQLDLMPARGTSAWPVVIAVLILGLGVLGWGLFAALRPNPCEGKYTSALFGYCADIPTGWAGGLRPVGDTYEDRFVEGASGDAQTTVRVERLVDTTVATPQYVQQFRTSQEATGFELSEIDPLILDGEQAFAWNYSVTNEGELNPVRVREVILVRPDGAWRIRLVATDEAYEEARFAFEEMLASWRWKA